MIGFSRLIEHAFSLDDDKPSTTTLLLTPGPTPSRMNRCGAKAVQTGVRENKHP